LPFSIEASQDGIRPLASSVVAQFIGWADVELLANNRGVD